MLRHGARSCHAAGRIGAVHHQTVVFAEFIATRKTTSWEDFLASDTAKQCCVDADWFPPGAVAQVLLYQDQYFIFQLPSEYVLTADRSLVHSASLEQLELKLYADICDEIGYAY
jgi:hypothetical protein